MVSVVKIWNQVVGAVLWDENWEIGSFEFEPDFVNSGLNLAPLTMPLRDLQEGRRLFSFPGLPKETFKGLPGMLAASLPDGFALRVQDTYITRTGKIPKDISPVERLCMTGRRGMGALEFEPTRYPGDNRSGIIFLEEIEQLAAEALLPTQPIGRTQAEHLEDLVRVSSSAAGQRAKALLAFNPETGEVRSGQTDAPEGFEHWMIKFDGITNRLLGDPRGYSRIEYAYNLMALHCGVHVPESTLLESGDRAHFLTRRFDRVNGNEKLHVVPLCHLAHMDYHDPTAWSYEKAFEVMRLLRLPHPDHRQLFLRLVFNVITRNYSDHTNNIAFLMGPDGIWHLAPAYDLTYSFHPDSRFTRAHQMSVQGKREQITRADLLALAREMNIKRPGQVIDAVAEATRRWPEFADQAKMPSAQMSVIRKNFLVP
jgi:serine/threonine-protein kinase HipA